jgi:aryl-alcohol dehydrogenase-like predicted oxidoreductase
MMPQRPLGQTGLSVSLLGYGGAPIGFAAVPPADTFLPLLHQALDLGINFFDTAPDYRDSEALLGEALQGRREQVVLASKCGRIQRRTTSGWAVEEDWSEAGVRQMIEGSLRRLRTDYLDLVHLHSPPLWALDNGAALRGLQRAQAEGLVRHIGVSADNEVAWRALELGSFATLQLSYSILQQEPGAKLIPAAAASGIGIIVKQPVANGIADLPTRPGHPDWAGKWDIAQRIDWAQSGAAERRTDLALRWVLTNPLVSTAIVGTTDPQHLASNVALATLPPLDETTYQRIEAAYYAARQQLSEEEAA